MPRNLKADAPLNPARLHQRVEGKREAGGAPARPRNVVRLQTRQWHRRQRRGRACGGGGRASGRRRRSWRVAHELLTRRMPFW